MSSKKLTVVIIAKNEESMLADCLDSVKFADSILVIDNDSTDETARIAKDKGAKVITSPSKSFAQLREVALTKVASGYILYIDADERVSQALSSEIQQALASESTKNAYRLRRQNYYLGTSPWPTVETLERLFKKSALLGWEGDLHETAKIKGDIGQLESPLIHYTHRDFSSMVEKTNAWSETEARLRFDASHPKVVPWRLFRVMVTAFIDSYIKQQGWKVGTTGLLESMYQAFSIFITYAKLWEMQTSNIKKKY